MFTNVDSWLSEVAQYLHNNTVGIFGNTPTANIFVGNLPNSPVAVVGLFATGGPHSSDGIDPFHRPTLQILIRTTSSSDGLRRAKLVFSLLDDKWNITPSFKGRILPDHLPGPNYLSDVGHVVYSLNFTGVLKE